MQIHYSIAMGTPKLYVEFLGLPRHFGQSEGRVNRFSEGIGSLHIWLGMLLPPNSVQSPFQTDCYLNRPEPHPLQRPLPAPLARRHYCQREWPRVWAADRVEHLIFLASHPANQALKCDFDKGLNVKVKYTFAIPASRENPPRPSSPPPAPVDSVDPTLDRLAFARDARFRAKAMACTTDANDGSPSRDDVGLAPPVSSSSESASNKLRRRLPAGWSVAVAVGPGSPFAFLPSTDTV